MIHYRYAEQFIPPAPFVNVSVQCLGTGSRAEKQPAQVDSAADRSVLPERLVEGLGLVEDGRLLFQGFAGQVVELPVFLVAIQVHDFPPVFVRAALGVGEPHILLGRDVLNAHDFLLAGPRLSLGIDRGPGGDAAQP
jgi:hypothetical protein